MARSLQFATLDVFTTKRFSGNPLAVVFLPEAKPLSQEQKQLIAREFNYSETIFLHPKDPQQFGNRKLDIFTTDQELPFAGHPTIGAASWFLQQSPGDTSEKPTSITTKAGEIPISVSAEDPKKVSAFLPHNVCIHSSRMPLAELLRLHPSLEPFLDAASLGDGFPLVSIVKGMTAVHVRLPSLEALSAVTTATEGYEIPAATPATGGHLDPGWDDGHVSVYFHVRGVWDDELQTKVIRSRMMAGNLEDPATGSAASGLAAYIALVDAEKKSGFYRIVQGVEMGQRSEIGLEIILGENGNEITDIELQGSAVKVSEGRIFMDN